MNLFLHIKFWLGTTIVWIAIFVIIIVGKKCFIPLKNLILSVLWILSSTKVYFIQIVWFSIIIWIMVASGLLCSIRFLFCYWGSSINSLFRYGSDWLSILVKDFIYVWYVCYLSLIIVTSNYLLGHLSNLGVSRKFGARGGSVRWLLSLIL